jgi:hypothetical protein
MKRHRSTGAPLGSIRIGRGVRPLSGFVIVLSYRHAICALFTVVHCLSQDQAFGLDWARILLRLLGKLRLAAPVFS